MVASSILYPLENLAEMHPGYVDSVQVLNFRLVIQFLTLKDAWGGRGVGQSVPFDFRLAAISHRIMLRSQKFLTLSIYIPSRR